MSIMAKPPLSTIEGERDATSTLGTSIKKHPMSATWYDNDPERWSFIQRIIVAFGMLPQSKGMKPAPVHTQKDKVPFYPVWKQWAWIVPRATMPLVLHRAYMELTGRTLHPIFAFFLYVS